MIIGIDLGTTYSAVAYMTDDGPRLIPNAIGEFLTPSVVGIDLAGQVLVGRVAKEFQVSRPDRCASIFKRHMGTDWRVTLDKQSYSPEELSSLVLHALKEDAEAFLQQPIERAVITVPAYFNDDQRKATIAAGKLAGLQVERIINEPTAAAIAYGLHESGEEKSIVVFDLGGGTFDVSVVEMFEGSVEVKASSGECFLGGEDFTRTIASRVLESQGIVFERAELTAPALVSRLMQQCEQAKRQLSREETAVVRVPNGHGEIPDEAARVEVTRAQFENWTRRLLSAVELPIRRGLGDAKLKRSDIDEVILVGGATRMPSVVRLVTEIFGREPRCRLNPDEVVALGAAVQAGLVGRHQRLDDLVVTDVAPFTLGVEVVKRFGAETRDGYYLPIINRNTTIPVSRVDRLQTVSHNQRRVVIKIYQGEGRRVEENLKIGEVAVVDIPLGPAGQEFDVRFTYDLNGVLEVEATIVATGKAVSLVITRHAKSTLTPAEIEAAVARMAALKTHPRDDARNQLVLKRAERMFSELPLFQRQRLGELLDAFEEALIIQEKEAVERCREALEMLFSVYESDPPDADPDAPYGAPPNHDW